MKKLLIFFGSDQYSAVVLRSLLSTDLTLHRLTDLRVVTTPPKPEKKTSLINPNEVDILANEQNIKVSYYPSNQDELSNFITDLKNTSKDTSIVGLAASFPRLFPTPLIDLFDGQLYNLHPSLLPQYRNVAPVPYAIAMGDNTTGITLQRIDSRIDRGDIISQQIEPIAPTDTTPTLLTRLFTLGANLFVQYIGDGKTDLRSYEVTDDLIFTHKLNRDSGYVEWSVVQNLMSNQPITLEDTANPLIKLRLTHHPDRTNNILSDLIRALTGYERVWTIAPTTKGNLPISIFCSFDKNSLPTFSVLLPGKPRPILYPQFIQNYI